ncbi:MFS transporter [bacterium D16-50]|nr:MFS transporter [Lachnospiraceae bacterium]RKJ21903.1 MFS transporter [bacterium D16-50]
MCKLTDKKSIKTMTFLLTVTYMVSYVTRLNFGAILPEMVEQTGMTKGMLSAAVTGSAVTYGLGQLLSGYLGDRVSPKRLVLAGLLVTGGMNFLILFCSGHMQMTAVWCVNGLAQAFLWPPMVRLMVRLFSDSDYKRTATMVSLGGSFGTIVVYLGAPLLIMLSGWRAVFAAAAAVGVVMAVFWQKCCHESEYAGEEQKQEDVSSGKKASVLAIWPLVLLVMLCIVLQGALRDGVTTWMPSYISETYKLGSEISILTGVALPIFSVVGVKCAGALYQKAFRNPLTCAGLIFGAGACFALALTFVSGRSTAGSVACSAVLTGCMYGANLMLVSMVPPFFQKYGKISTVSGLLNCCAYVGSAVSTYGIALLSERAGWTATVFVWFVAALAGTALCFLAAHIWKKKI